MVVLLEEPFPSRNGKFSVSSFLEFVPKLKVYFWVLMEFKSIILIVLKSLIGQPKERNCSIIRPLILKYAVLQVQSKGPTSPLPM